jgi:hypothetical protein
MNLGSYFLWRMRSIAALRQTECDAAFQRHIGRLLSWRFVIPKQLRSNRISNKEGRP